MRFENKTVKNEVSEKIETDRTIQGLGQQLTQEKLANIQKDTLINSLGQQVADLKLQIIKIQGGTN